MPKIALISDIHANLPALETVLDFLDRKNPDMWICLGDLVGYGAFPSECIDIIRERKIPIVKGNHDAGVTGEINHEHFRDPNRTLIKKTQEILSEDQIDWLKTAPLMLKDVQNSWIAAHASPIEPEKWRYLESAFTVRDILSKTDSTFCFVGHTHLPALVSDQIGIQKIEPNHKYLINPGSVGQSRDSDYRASCGLLDTDESTYQNFRLDYDIEFEFNALLNLGFSDKEARRLLRY